jgi:hypothetical protein
VTSSCIILGSYPTHVSWPQAHLDTLHAGRIQFLAYRHQDDRTIHTACRPLVVQLTWINERGEGGGLRL